MSNRELRLTLENKLIYIYIYIYLLWLKRLESVKSIKAAPVQSVDKDKIVSNNNNSKSQNIDDIDFWQMLEITLKENGSSLSSAELTNFINMMKKV